MRHPWLTLAAVLGWVGLSVQLYLILLMRWQEQASLIGGLINAFSYFTMLSNTLVAMVLSYAAFGRESAARRWFLSPAVSSGIFTCIVLVAVTYSLLLRHLWQPHGWQRLADELLHDIMPLLYTVYWWRRVPKGTLRWRHLPLWGLFPIAYFGFSLLRGHIIGVYPYPFVDVATLGYPRVMLNALAMLAAFLGVGMLVLGLDRWQGRRLVTARSPT